MSGKKVTKKKFCLYKILEIIEKFERTSQKVTKEDNLWKKKWSRKADGNRDQLCCVNGNINSPFLRP